MERPDGNVTSSTDKQIAEAVAAAGGSNVSSLGLRFDRVVVRVMDRLRRFVEAGQPENLTVVLTLTAPIRVPGKTVAALEQKVAALLRTGQAGSERSAVLHGNRAELRLVEHSPSRRHRLLVFVHNTDADAARLLDLAERWLLSSA